MLIRTKTTAATAAAVLLLGSLGLGGCSSGSTATVTHTAALNTTGGRDTARSSVQSSILIADTTNGIALPGGPTPAGIVRTVLAMMRNTKAHARGALATGSRGILATGASTGPCNNGTKTSAVTNADNSQTTTTDLYYDAACATLELEQSVTLLSPSTPTTTLGNAKITSFSTGGAIRVVETLTIDAETSQGEETLTVQGTSSATAGGTATGGIGETCQGTPGSATLTCTAAHWGTSNGTVQTGSVTGESFSTTATAGTGGGNATATVGVGLYTGSTLGVAQQSGTTTWTVTGSSGFNSESGTFGYTSSGPTGAGTLVLKDSLYTYTSTATLSATGLSVVIVENPNGIVTVDTPIATAAVDAAGNGTLTYADGSSETIAAGLIGY